jgi:hypothetical protein
MTNNPYKEIAEQADRKRIRCEKSAKKYFPKNKIELLLVGESPPIGETYFYIPEDLRRSAQGLPAKIFRALFDAHRIDKRKCEKYLRKFQNRKFLLIDLIPFPIDGLTSSFRAEIIEKEISLFSKRVRKLRLSSSCKKLLVLPSGTYGKMRPKAKSRFNRLGFTITKWGEAELKLAEIAKTLRRRKVL